MISSILIYYVILYLHTTGYICTSLFILSVYYLLVFVCFYLIFMTNYCLHRFIISYVCFLAATGISVTDFKRRLE